MTPEFSGVFNGMAPLVGLSCDLARVIPENRPPQDGSTVVASRFILPLADVRLHREAFVGLQAQGLCVPCSPDAPAPDLMNETAVSPVNDTVVPVDVQDTASPAPVDEEERVPAEEPAVQQASAPQEVIASEQAEASDKLQPSEGPETVSLPTDLVAGAETPEPVTDEALQAVAPPQPRPSGQSFAAVCRDLVAIMTLPSGQAQPQERLFAGDALVGLLPHLQPAELINLTRTVARLDLVSEQLRSFLVRHPDNDISCRMLKDASHLSDVDILALIPRASEQQLRLIARRRKLTMNICDAIINNGNKNAILDLLRNAEAELSPGAFAALPALVKGQEELTSALCNRADLPQSIGIKLFWQANGNLRRYILSRFLTESAALGRVFDVGIAAGTIPPIGGQVKPADVEQMIAQIETGSPDAVDTLARLCRVSPETASLIVNDTGGEPIAVVFKSLAQSRLSMAEALKRWAVAGRFGISTNQRIVELHALFDALSYNKARKLLAYWDWASREAGPYTVLHT